MSHPESRLREANKIVEGSKQQRSISIRNFELAWFLEEFWREFLLGNFQNVEKQTDFRLKLIRKDVENVYAYMYRLYFSSWSKTVFLLQGF